MVRGNWQRRVERAEARRKEAKEDRQKLKDKRQHKQWVQDMVRFLDRMQQNRQMLERFLDKMNGGRPLIKFHIWTDTLASLVPCDDECDNNDDDDDEQIENDVDEDGYSPLPIVQRKYRSISLGSENESVVPVTKSHQAKTGRERSKSISEGKAGNGRIPDDDFDDDEGKRVGRNRSNSTPEHYRSTRKKPHPRSHTKETPVEESSGDGIDPPKMLMSRSQFFSNKKVDSECIVAGASRTGKKNSIGSHGNQNGKSSNGSELTVLDSRIQTTLWSVMTSNGTSTNTITTVNLNEAEQAFKSSISEELIVNDPGVMEMVFYYDFDLQHNIREDNEGNDDIIPFSEQILDKLFRKQIKYANIVYAVFGDVLIFDRYRDGLLYKNQDSEFWTSIVRTDDKNNTIHRKNSIEKAESTKQNDQIFSRDLPGAVLEQILTFLPDSAVGSASRVCKAWHHEIGKNSPHLWKYLLQRRGWPEPPIAPTDCIPDSNDVNNYVIPNNDSDGKRCRDEFVRYYTASRDLLAIQSALRALTSKKHVKEKEMSFLDFSTRKFSPTYPNYCVGVKVWSPRRLLAAYENDCSLRLFETVPKSIGSNEIQCREIVCQKIDPYRNTKRRVCRVMSMGLDDECIGCLCNVMAENAYAYILVIISRDDFLLGESCRTNDTNGNRPDESTLHVIDIGEAFINYVLSSELVDYRLLEVFDFIAAGGQFGEIEVMASDSIVACGNGRFMVEIAIHLPNDDPYDAQMEESRMIDRKLILFSARIGAIVWMGEYCTPGFYFNSFEEEEMILSYRRLSLQGSRQRCVVAVSAGTSCPLVMVTEISPTGDVHQSSYIEASHIVREEVEGHGWTMKNGHPRSLVVSETDIIAGDTLVRYLDESRSHRYRKSVLSFYPRTTVDVQQPIRPSYTLVTIPDGMVIARMSCLRNDHLVVLCHKYKNPIEQEDNFDDDDDDGSIEALMYHIPSRREIGRLSLLSEISSFKLSEVPILSMDCFETIGVALSCKGVIMTGPDVRSVVGRTTSASSSTTGVHVLDDIACTRSTKKKNKKGGKPKQSNHSKKDLFARGMSLRG